MTGSAALELGGFIAAVLGGIGGCLLGDRLAGRAVTWWEARRRRADKKEQQP